MLGAIAFGGGGVPVSQNSKNMLIIGIAHVACWEPPWCLFLSIQSLTTFQRVMKPLWRLMGACSIRILMYLLLVNVCSSGGTRVWFETEQQRAYLV